MKDYIAVGASSWVDLLAEAPALNVQLLLLKLLMCLTP